MSVFITGASSGIGEACARAFAAVGQDVILAARRVDRLEKLAAALRKEFGVQSHVLSLDVSQRAQIENWVRAQPVLAASVEVLINNAGLARGREPIQEGNPENWDAMIDTNVKGLLYVTRALLPGIIKKAQQGALAHVVNVGSVAGHWVYPDGNVYCASKYAVKALNEGMRLDLHGTGVRVTEIAPGMVGTEFSLVRFGGDSEKAQAVYSGVDHLLPEDIAEAILWCVQRPKRVNIQEMVVYPTDQASVGMLKRGR